MSPAIYVRYDGFYVAFDLLCAWCLSTSAFQLSAVSCSVTVFTMCDVEFLTEHCGS
jgi:hypothetical protein